ncbi:hypothetical protein FPV67DRAFT_1677910 [Lyophyllum atratum]|nr:hypothetical protein FPV67DRAFT_1677910 [Lyophyllum atratum]
MTNPASTYNLGHLGFQVPNQQNGPGYASVQAPNQGTGHIAYPQQSMPTMGGHMYSHGYGHSNGLNMSMPNSPMTQAPIPTMASPGLHLEGHAMWSESPVVGNNNGDVVLQQVQNTIARLQAAQELLDGTVRQQSDTIKQQENKIRSMEAEATKTRPLTGNPQEKNDKLKCVVRAVMKDLLGMDGKMMLPAPLKSGEALRTAPDGTRMWNPDWSEGPTVGSVNPDYIKTVVRIAKQREVATPTAGIPGGEISESVLRKMAHAYFGTLRNNYRTATTEAGAKRRAKKNIGSKIRNRKHMKSNKMREQIEVFQATYGEAETEGLENIILTDWMSSEHSNDESDETTNEFKAHKKKHVGSNPGLEVRELKWRSLALKKIYARLKKFHRDAARPEPGQPRNARGRRGVGRRARYPGFSGHANHDPPILATRFKLKPFAFCVSRRWARETDNESMALDPDLENFTISTLTIPTSDLDAEDLEYLGDDEEDDQEDEAGAQGGDAGNEG